MGHSVKYSDGLSITNNRLNAQSDVLFCNARKEQLTAPACLICMQTSPCPSEMIRSRWMAVIIQLGSYIVQLISNRISDSVQNVHGVW